MQGQITELQQEIKETRAINHLDPYELKEKIQDVLACRNDQRLTNSQLEEQIKKLRDRLNILRCGDALQDHESDNSEKKRIEAETEAYERIYVNAEAIHGVMVNTHDEAEIVIGSSRSADAVSENKVKTPRETKSDQDQSPRGNESVPVHNRALLHRRQSSAERFRNLMKSTDQVECPPGEGAQISPRQLPPLLLPSKQPPDEAMPTHGARHPTWPRPSYVSGQLPGCHVPLPPLHPRIDDDFPKKTNPLPPMFPCPSERDIPTPAIKTPLPPICSGQSDGDNTTPNYSPSPPFTIRLTPINRPKTGGARRVSLLSTCCDPLGRDTSNLSLATQKYIENRKNPVSSSKSESDLSVSSGQSQMSPACLSPPQYSSAPNDQADSSSSFSSPVISEKPLPARNHDQRPPSSTCRGLNETPLPAIKTPEPSSSRQSHSVPRPGASDTPRHCSSGTPRQCPSGTPRQCPSGTPRQCPSGTPRQCPSGTPRIHHNVTPRSAIQTQRLSTCGGTDGRNKPANNAKKTPRPPNTPRAQTTQRTTTTPRAPITSRAPTTRAPTTTREAATPHSPNIPSPTETELRWRKWRSQRPPSPKLQPFNEVYEVDGVSLKFF